MMGHRSGRYVVLLSAVTFVLTLQFGHLIASASGTSARVGQRSVHAADSRELVAAGNTLKATNVARKPAPLALTGGAVAPAVSIAFLLMLDGVLMIWFARPKEQLI